MSANFFKFIFAMVVAECNLWLINALYIGLALKYKK
jgi:hypothetical protein